MWATHSGGTGVVRAQIWYFFMLFLFLFCDDVWDSPRTCVTGYKEKGEVKARQVGNLILCLTL